MNDTRKFEALLQEFADAYIQFVKEQLAKHMPADQAYTNAQAIVLGHTGGLVATSLATAVWSADAARKISKAGNN